MGYMQTSFTWSILFFTNVCKKINCFKVFRLTGAWTWDTKGWHTILWAYIKFLELAYNSISLHKVPWACMQFHELACSFMTLYAVAVFVWAAHKNFAVLVFLNTHISKYHTKSFKGPQTCHIDLGRVSMTQVWSEVVSISRWTTRWT